MGLLITADFQRASDERFREDCETLIKGAASSLRLQRGFTAQDFRIMEFAGARPQTKLQSFQAQIKEAEHSPERQEILRWAQAGVLVHARLGQVRDWLDNMNVNSAEDIEIDVRCFPEPDLISVMDTQIYGRLMLEQNFPSYVQSALDLSQDVYQKVKRRDERLRGAAETAWPQPRAGVY